MKNRILPYILLFALIFSGMGCNDEFLERFPLDEISNETFWNTENDLQVYNNSLYDLARDDNNVPILMAHDDDGTPLEPRHAADDGRVLGEGPVAV